jgi:hypothetical protein
VRSTSAIAAVALAAAALLQLAAARGQSVHEAVPAAAGGTMPAYSPGLGEIMTLQQMRHSKLWFAGRARNWELAGYELDELKEGFDDVAKFFPVHEDIPLTPMVEAITGKEIPNLAKVIEGRDIGKFASAFDQLTAACDGCHQSAHRGFIVIRRPISLPYSNQSFAPARH